MESWPVPEFTENHALRASRFFYFFYGQNLYFQRKGLVRIAREMVELGNILVWENGNSLSLIGQLRLESTRAVLRP